MAEDAIASDPRKPRTYTDLERANALAVLAACGGNVTRAARECGIPEKTLAYWRDRPTSGQLRATVAIREQLMGQSIERMLWRLIRSMKGKVREAKLPGVVNAFGLMFDRLRLLRSNPTTQPEDLAPDGLDLSRLTADELRTLQAIVSKASPISGADSVPVEGAIVDVTDYSGVKETVRHCPKCSAIYPDGDNICDACQVNTMIGEPPAMSG